MASRRSKDCARPRAIAAGLLDPDQSCTRPGRHNHPMRVLVRPLPVLYACQGCAELGQTARDVGMMLERRGFAQTVWLGSVPENSSPAQRFPIFALDGCAKECAKRWLAAHGTACQRAYVIPDHARGVPERAVDGILASQ